MSKKKVVDASGVITYSGSLVGLNFGQPNVMDIAVQCMRQCRFSGALKEWWPVGMHQMLTADIMDTVLKRPELVLDCLLHDAPEAIFGDTPTPVKTAERRGQENKLQARIYLNLNITLPTANQRLVIKEADMLALVAEATELGLPTFAIMLKEFIGIVNSPSWYVVDSRHIMSALYRGFNPMDALNSEGRHVTDYCNRVFAEILHRHSE